MNIKNSLLMILVLSVRMVSQAASTPVTPTWYDSHWYRKPLVQGLFYYAKVKKFILEHNVLPNEEINTQRKDCTGAQKFRSYDGSCNDFQIPFSGAAGTAFSRNMPTAYKKRSLQETDARKISLQLFTRHQFIPNRYSNLLAASFLQFCIHDWISHEESYEDLDVMPLDPQDPMRISTGQKEILVPKTVARNSRVGTPLYRNQVTHWFDASQIYGSDEKTALSLREGRSGRLKLDEQMLPRDRNGQEVSGDTRNWWLGLSLMHTLFAREHNYIAGQLEKIYPNWDDEKLYQTARLIVSAETVKLFMTELSGARFDNDILRTITIGNWYGPVNAFLNFKRHGLKTPATPGWEKILMENSTLTGLIGSKVNNRGVGFSMTEEWAQVYKYHTLIPDTIHIKPAGVEVPAELTRGSQAPLLIQNYGFANLLRSFGAEASGKVTLNNMPHFLQELHVPFLGVIDVGAIDIYRERERGLMRFNDFRRYIGLAPYRSIDDMTQDKVMSARIKAVYGDDVEQIDLTVGLLAEARESHFELGETTVQSLALVAIRRIESDRFFTTDYNEKTYTKFGLNWVDKLTFKDLLLRHFPELRNDLNQVVNPFQRWSIVETSSR